MCHFIANKWPSIFEQSGYSGLDTTTGDYVRGLSQAEALHCPKSKIAAGLDEMVQL